MKIGEALSILKRGGCVARTGWNGTDMFVFRQVPATIPDHVVPNMQSLPQAVKNEFIRRFNEEQIDAIYYDNQLTIVNNSNLIQGWSPSVSDTLAIDWIVIHEPIEE